MGSNESSYEIPIPILTFGPDTLTESGLIRLQSQAAQVNKFVGNVDRLVKLGTLVGSNAIKSAGTYTGPLTIALTLLSQLLEDTNKLHLAMDKMELRIFNTILDGKLKALMSAKNVISDPHTSDSQLVAELVWAIHQFEEILPIFANKDSIMSKFYYLGAPLFVQICSIFKLIATFAEGSSAAGYRNPNLSTLKSEYAETLRSYKFRCIRQRLRSTYVMQTKQAAVHRHVSDELVFFGEYFTKDNCCRSGFMGDIHDDKGFEDKLLHCAPHRRTHRLNVMDHWDPRPDTQISFRTLVISHDEREISVCLRKYRQDVKELMEEFFEANSI